MTDFSSRDLDALASDLVDGLLPPDEAARARQDPEVAARVASFEAMRSALRSVPPPDPAMTDRILAVAIAAASSPVEELPQTRHLAAVPPSLPPPPARPVRPSTRRWLAAAAVIVVAGLVTAGLIARSGHDSDDLADAPTSAEDSAKGGAPGAAPTTSAPTSERQGDSAAPGATSSSSSTTAETMASSDDLGSVDSAKELAARVAQDFDDEKVSATAPGSGLSTETEASEACPGLTAAGDPSRGRSLFTDDATYDGSPVVVHVYEHKGERRLVATNSACRDVVDVPYGD
jgi:negative regulator of sigma E activity